MFNVVRFPNMHCDAGGNKNGTCYTKDECEQRGGINDGGCAEGYGVCCTFTLHCGDKSSENNTYFESDGDEKGHCSVKICKNKPSIVQLRLDFETFTIAGPSITVTDTVQTASNNVVAVPGATATASNYQSQCLTDSFAVSNPGGHSPPVICGSNNDYHMYVDASEDCNDLTFTVKDNTNFINGRAWTVRVTQYDGGFENLAPPGCTQYFWDKEDTDGELYSYNWNGGNGRHLADQKQVICIRREENKNKICYSAADTGDISISGPMLGAGGCPTYAGGYNAAGSLQHADVLLIQSATDPANNAPLAYSNICGQNSRFAGVATICTTAKPFRITFHSDSFEEDAMEMAGTPGNQAGFHLTYYQS